MPLTTHVTDRFGTNGQYLRGLTNHDDNDADTVNTTRLAQATAAAEAQFPLHAGVAYDDTDDAHINAGVSGTIAYLRAWSTSSGKADASLASFRDELRAIRAVSAGKRVTPTTKSVLTPSEPDTSNGAVRPDFDRTQFDGIAPNAPDGETGRV